MSQPERIFNFLVERREPFCDDCIQTRLELSQRQQVQPVSATLGLTSDFERAKDICAGCGDEKFVVKYVR
jgi:hypothetical protein